MDEPVKTQSFFEQIDKFCATAVNTGKIVLSDFIYLEHGAHYAIGALAIIMLLSTRFHVPEIVTGLIGVAFIVLSVFNSIQYNKRHANS